MTLLQLIEQSAVNALDHGFDVTQHETQLLLVGTEIAEALEHVEPGNNQAILEIRETFEHTMFCLEDFRRQAKDYTDTSAIPTAQHRSEYVEELADIIIRVCSYAGGNGMALDLVLMLEEKTSKNKARPYRHGKGF
jgi:NTP pyrophosphatase (non-canonical NTP hydrolase)